MLLEPEGQQTAKYADKILGHSQVTGICSTDFKSAPLRPPSSFPPPDRPPHSSSRPPTPPIFHHPPPSTTANNSVITDFFPPTAGDSANLLIKDPITMGSVWTDYNRSRNTAVLILEDSCLGASQTGPSPPLKVGMNHKAPRPPHLHRAHSVQQAGKNGWPRRCFSLYNYRPKDGRGGVRAARGWGAGFLVTSDGSGGSASFLIFPDLFFLSLALSSLFSLPSRPPTTSLFSFPPLPSICSNSPPSPSPLSFPVFLSLFPPTQH